MANKVFISHASPDKKVADAICARLEQRGIRCWIAPRDISPGVKWGTAIVEAIGASAVMVLVLSSPANLSPHVYREVERAVSKGVVVVPFRIEAISPSKDLEFFLSAEHWLDAITPPIEEHIRRLGDAVNSLLGMVRAAAPLESKVELELAAAKFEEVAPEEWRQRHRTGLMAWVQNLLAEKL